MSPILGTYTPGSPPTWTGSGAKGLPNNEDATRNPFARVLTSVVKSLDEIEQVKPTQTDKQPGSGKNLVKISEILFHRLECMCRVEGEGTPPDTIGGIDVKPVSTNIAEDLAGAETTVAINIYPLLGNVAQGVVIPIGSTWAFDKAATIRDFNRWAITFWWYTAGSGGFNTHLITGLSTRWDNFIAQLYTGAKAAYKQTFQHYPDDYMDETLQMVEYRTDNDD